MLRKSKKVITEFAKCMLILTDEKNRQLEITKDIHEGRVLIPWTIKHYQAFFICF